MNNFSRPVRFQSVQDRSASGQFLYLNQKADIHDYQYLRLSLLSIAPMGKCFCQVDFVFLTFSAIFS